MMTARLTLTSKSATSQWNQ